MTTFTYYDEAVAAGAVWVRHLGCPEVVVALRDCEVDDLDKLVCERCESERRGSGYGFVEAPSPRYDAVGNLLNNAPWTPFPHWLLRGEGPPLTDREFRVLCALWSFQSPNEETWRSVEEIAAATGKSPRNPRQTEEILRRLADRGLVRRWRAGKRGRFHYDLRPLMRRQLPPRPEETLRSRSEETLRSTPEEILRTEVEPSEEEPLDEDAVFDGSADALRSSESTSTDTSGVEPPRAHARTREAADDSDRTPAAFKPLAVGVELGARAAVEPPAEVAEQDAVADAHAVLAGLGDGLAAAGDGAASGTGSGDGFGIGHALDVRGPDADGIEPLSGLVGGPCPDPACCAYRWRYAAGPWGCAHNHPRADGSAPEGRNR